MKRLLVICQKVDEQDDLLGFFVAWLRQFARHFDRVDVITLGAWKYDLPGNVRVYSLGKERGSWRLFRLIRLKWLLLRLTPGASSVFCHMSPVFSIVAWPFAKIFRVRLVLWYLHRSVTLRLWLALALCDNLITADVDSLGVKSQKIISVGHGIDTGYFAVDDRRFDSSRPLHIISVGRLAPIKDFGTLISAAEILKKQGIAVHVRIVGRAVEPHDSSEEHRLREMVSTRGLQDIVSFTGYVPYPYMRAQYAWADVAVGCTPRGGIDKVLLEAMAAGCVVLTSNDVMGKYLGPYADRLMFRHGNPADLSAKLAHLPEPASAGAAMVASVRRHHNLAETINHIANVL